MSPSSAPPVFTRAYELTLRLMELTDAFPKAQRPLLGRRIQDSLLGLLVATTRAWNGHERQRSLEEGLCEVDTLRILLRLAADRRILALGHHRQAAADLNEIGRMLGGWLRKTQHLDKGSIRR